MLQQNQITYEGKKKRKAIAIVLCLILAVTLVIGSLFAYFSDVLTGDQSMEAGTLELEGGAVFYINESTTAATDEDLECINPGDQIRVEIEVENVGSKSAWLQGSFEMSAEDMDGAKLGAAFKVFEGAGLLGDELLSESDAGNIHFEDEGDAIINGTIEKETADGAIGDTETTMIFTIYFLPTAGNEYQAAKIDIDYAVKALQYRNNPTPDWDDAVKLIKS